MKALVIDQMIIWLIYVFREITHPMLFFTIGSVGCKHSAFWNVIMMVRNLSMQSNLSDRYQIRYEKERTESICTETKAGVDGTWHLQRDTSRQHIPLV